MKTRCGHAEGRLNPAGLAKGQSLIPKLPADTKGQSNRVPTSDDLMKLSIRVYLRTVPGPDHDTLHLIVRLDVPSHLAAESYGLVSSSPFFRCDVTHLLG